MYSRLTPRAANEGNLNVEIINCYLNMNKNVGCEFSKRVAQVMFSTLLALTSASVFESGAFKPSTSPDVTVFHAGIGGFKCVRVPGLLVIPANQTDGAPNAIILAFAECRNFVGDNCNPTNDANANSSTTITDERDRVICGRRSVDGGLTWSTLNANVSSGVRGSYPTATWHAPSRRVVLQFSSWPNMSTPGTPYYSPVIMQAVSSDQGLSWSAPRVVDELSSTQVFLGGCRGLSVPSSNNLMFVGYNHDPPIHASRSFVTRVWTSDDGGSTYKVVTQKIIGSEPQLVAVSKDGARIQLYLRTNGSIPNQPPKNVPSISLSSDGGLTWSTSRPSAVPAQGEVLTSVTAAWKTDAQQVPTMWYTAPIGPTSRANLTLFQSDDIGTSWKVLAQLPSPADSIVEYQRGSYSCVDHDEAAGAVLVLRETAAALNDTTCTGACRIVLMRRSDGV
eukprot:m.180121 g.180121  ORF g.180121 m.180121 type:complete len:449 (-) comp32006_c0_seq1:146-1492(-)